MSTSDMPCPSCGAALSATRTQRGIVWLCGICKSGAATLPILRRLAPRHFVNHIWQAARRHGGDSENRCPSCRQPFTTFLGSPVAVQPNLEVCTRCQWVWLGADTLRAFSGLEAPTARQGVERLAAVSVRDEDSLARAEARE